MSVTYVKPQVLVFQEFSIVPNEVTDPLRAHISGPNALLHRYDEDDEKILINVGPYDKDDDAVYPWPERQAGSLVDEASVRLMIEDALLLYHEDLIGDASEGRGLVQPVSTRKNWIRSSALSYKANGTQWPRSGLFLDRDVQVGDVAYVRGVTGVGSACDEHDLWTTVTGFAADTVAATVFPATVDDNNQLSTAAVVTSDQIDGVVNCVGLTNSNADYDGLEDGYVNERYEVEVIRSSIAGCQAARLRIVSDSGTDNVDEVDPGDFGDWVEIGTRGLEVQFNTTTGDCSLSASSESVESDQFVVGQKWEIDATQAFERGCLEVVDDSYAGPDIDTYVVEVTKGGLWADLPEVTVTTVKGLDSSGPTTVTSDSVAFPVGAWGLTAQFVDCQGSSVQSIDSASSVSLGDGSLAGLRTGDKFYVSVVSGANGPIRTLTLQDDLPIAIQSATDLDLRLFIPKTIEVTEARLSSPPLVNYEIESTQLAVKAGITAYDADWTDSGVEQPMTVWDGRLASTTDPNSWGIQYIEYREWLSDLADEVNFIDDVADIDEIPGQLDELNLLKWGVYRALQNSNGTKVAYTAVADPDDLDSWQDVLERVDGRDDLYNFVPLTYTREVHNLFQAHVTSESSAESGNWKAMFVNAKTPATKMVVGKSDADTQALTPTSIDGEVVLATLEDNPDATAIQYTLLSVPDSNAGFITYGVEAGDVVRFLYTIDAFGNQSYSEFIVDTVLSQSSLLLLSGHSSPISVAQKIEIWHTQEKGELVEAIVDIAQSFADRRVCVVWPDIVGTGGNAQDGYFLCCALAGLASGVVPQQGLTNVEIAGFDDLSSRTRDYFSDSQLDELAAGGVWIGTEDRDGTPHTRHALTTNMLDLNRKEEMVRRNVDSMSYLFLRRLRPYIGRSNATPTMLRALEYHVNQTIKFLKSNGVTTELGAQLVSGSIRLDPETEAPMIYIHPLAADRVVIIVDLVVPYPLNNIELHLVV